MDSPRVQSGSPAFRIAGSGVSLSAEAHGDIGGPAVILLHGGGQSRSAWRSAAVALGARGYRAISVDLRGHGESDWAADGDYSLERHVADVAAVIRSASVPAMLVGASLGGHIALLAGAAHPDLIGAIALADTTPFLDEDQLDGLRAQLRAGATGFATIDEAAAHIALVRGGGERPAGARLREHLMRGRDGRLYWRWDVRAIEDRFVRHAGEGGLFAGAASRLTVPTLMMRAGNSTLTTRAQVDRFRQIAPHIETVEIAGIGHMLTGDSNRAYLPALLDFLSRHGDGAGK